MSKQLRICLGFVFSRFTGMQRLGQVVVLEGPASFFSYSVHNCTLFPCVRVRGVTHDDSWFQFQSIPEGAKLRQQIVLFKLTLVDIFVSFEGKLFDNLSSNTEKQKIYIELWKENSSNRKINYLSVKNKVLILFSLA